MNEAMNVTALEAAYAASLSEPTLDILVDRFTWALKHAGGDREAAMAAVNEGLAVPIPYATFLDRIVAAAQ